MYIGVKFEIFLVAQLVLFMAIVQSASKAHIYSKTDLQEKTSFFNSDEHDLIGQSVNLPGLPDNMLTLPNGIKVSFSKIVALAGDFFGVPEAPIIDATTDRDDEVEGAKRRERFLAAFGKLATDTDENVASMVNRLVTMIDEDHEARESGGELHSNAEWDTASGGVWLGGLPLDFGNMIKLAAKNFDHFEPQANQAWIMGHDLALEKAYEAHNEEDEETKKNLLMEAYAREAFAAHFLTDIFAGGHIRTPRAALHYLVTPAMVGDYLSKYMHDEDCKYGVRVKNDRGDRWIAYGDKYILANGNKRNHELVNEAIQLSVQQVYDFYQDPTQNIHREHVFEILPSIDPDATNNAPLFQMKNRKLHRRKSVGNLQDQHTISDWWGTTTIVLLQNQGETKHNSALPPSSQE